MSLSHIPLPSIVVLSNVQSLRNKTEEPLLDPDAKIFL